MKKEPNNLNEIKLNRKIILSVLTSYVCEKFDINKKNVHSVDLEYQDEFIIRFIDKKEIKTKNEEKIEELIEPSDEVPF